MEIEKGGETWRKKEIYIHVIRMEDDESTGVYSGYMGASNQWYVIKQGSHGSSPSTISPAFEDVEQHSDIGRPLIGTGCEVIGSSIFIIGGRDVLHKFNCYALDDEVVSNKIRCIDTLDPTPCWKTCVTMPFRRSGGKSSSAVNSEGRWLYVFRGNRHDPAGLTPKFWGIAVNLDDESKSYPIPEPDFPPNLPLAVRTPLYPPSWSLSYRKDLPSPPSGFFGGFTVSDGIFYVYNTDEMCLFAYDLLLGKEIYSVELPRSFCFGHNRYLYMAVLDGPYNNLCIIWGEYSWGINNYYLHYTRFSVSPCDSPPVTFHETQSFRVCCSSILNIVTLDPSSPVMPIS